MFFELEYGIEIKIKRDVNFFTSIENYMQLKIREHS